MEEIEHAEPQLQSVRILRKRGDEVMVIEEEDTTREMRRLKTALAGVMKQIKCSSLTLEIRVHHYNCAFAGDNSDR